MLFIAFILCIFFTAGCAKETTEQSERGECFDFESVGETTEGQKNIYVVLKVLKSQYWQDIVDGTEAAATEFGCNLYVGSTELEGDWETQEQLLDTAVNSGADAILLAPANSTKLSSKVSEINQKIPVILVDTILSDTSSFDTCYMTDNIQAGELAAEEMLNLLESKGLDSNKTAHIAIQIASVSSQTVIDLLAGFNKYWSENAPKNWQVIDDVKQNNGNTDVAKQNCMDLINDYPDLKGLFGCNNSSTVGLVQGLKEMQRDDIVLVGFDLSDDIAELIKSDKWSASTIVQNQYNMGYNGVVHAVNIINNNDNNYKFVDTGTRIVNHENYSS
jgi:ribose transport system substrate-binding protein